MIQSHHMSWLDFIAKIACGAVCTLLWGLYNKQLIKHLIACNTARYFYPTSAFCIAERAIQNTARLVQISSRTKIINCGYFMYMWNTSQLIVRMLFWTRDMSNCSSPLHIFWQRFQSRCAFFRSAPGRVCRDNVPATHTLGQLSLSCSVHSGLRQIRILGTRGHL